MAVGETTSVVMTHTTFKEDEILDLVLKAYGISREGLAEIIWNRKPRISIYSIEGHQTPSVVIWDAETDPDELLPAGSKWVRPTVDESAIVPPEDPVKQ